MTTQPITITLPSPFYQQLQNRATQKRHTLEQELLDVVTQAMPTVALQPQSLDELLESLELFDDDELWQAARSHLADEAAERMAELNWRRQRSRLTELETQELLRLGDQYERAMLVRAHAAALLKQRGYDVSEAVMRQ